MDAELLSYDFPVRRTRVLCGAGDEEVFETEASPPAVAGPSRSRPAPQRAPAGKSKKAAKDVAAPGRLLLDLVTGTGTLHDSLDLLASTAAQEIGSRAAMHMECGVVLQQEKRPPAVVGTSPAVMRLLDWEQENIQGPVCGVLADGYPVAALQRDADFRWPDYCGGLQTAGFGSVLAVRLRLDLSVLARQDIPHRPARAALAFFARQAKAFPLPLLAEARSFADVAARSLQLAMTLHAAVSMVTDLRSALDSRTSINVACGVIMAQNRCSYREAFSILAQASSHRNTKVRRVAEDMLSDLPGGLPAPHFDH